MVTTPIVPIGTRDIVIVHAYLGARLATVCADIPLAATKKTFHGQTAFSRPYGFHGPPVGKHHESSGASRPQHKHHV